MGKRIRERGAYRRRSGPATCDPGKQSGRQARIRLLGSVDWIVREAAARGIYVGMVAAWGSVVDQGILKADNVQAYSRFLADRYRDDPNIV